MKKKFFEAFQHIKKNIIGYGIILFFIFLWIIFGTGNISNINIEIDQSDVHSEKEIRFAMQFVKLQFFLLHRGEILTDLWYDENLSTLIAEDLKDRGEIENTKDAMILLSNIKEKKKDGDVDNSFDWLLVRNKITGLWKARPRGGG